MATRDFRIKQGLLVGDSDLHYSLQSNKIKLKTGAQITIGNDGNRLVEKDELDIVNARLDSDSAEIQRLSGLVSADTAALRADLDSDSGAIQALRTDLTTAEGNITTAQNRADAAHTRLDSDHALFQAKISAGLVNLADSDLIVSQLEAKISTIITDMDSDSTIIQALRTDLDAEIAATNTDVTELKARLDSDTAAISAVAADLAAEISATNTDITEVKSRLDSDSGEIQRLSGLISGNTADLRADLDSDSAVIQTLRTDLDAEISATNSDITEIKSRLDSDEDEIQRLKTELKSMADSDSGVVQALGEMVRARLDSDDAALQGIRTDLATAQSDITDIKARLDSDDGAITEGDARAITQEIVDSDYINTRLHLVRGGQFAVDSDGQLMVITDSDLRDSTGVAIRKLREDRDSDHSLFQSKFANLSSNQIVDADGDTKIQVEEGTDDDTIRFDTAGTERLVIDSSGQITANSSYTPSDNADLATKKYVDDNLLNLADSDLIMSQLNAKISGIITDMDSDSTIIQALRTDLDAEIAATNTDVTELKARLDSDTGAISQVAADLAAEITATNTDITEVKSRLDSDSAELQRLSGLVAGDTATLKARLDSDEIEIQRLKTELKAMADSDSGVVQALGEMVRARLDSDDAALQQLRTDLDAEIAATNTDITAIQSRLDSDRADRHIMSDELQIGGGDVVFERHTGNTTSTTQTDIYTHPVATFKGAKLLVTVDDTVSGERQITELLVTHDDTNVAFVEYGIVYTGSDELATFDVDINGGNIRLRATASSANSTDYTVSEIYTV